MTEKERTCETCAWWENVDPFKDIDPNPGQIFEGVCHLNPQGVDVNSDWWCRHWSETTGWDRFEKRPTELEQWAAKIIDTILNGDKDDLVSPEEMDAWLEEYRKNC